MNLIENVYEMAESFMKNSTEVEINYDRIEEMSNDMLIEGRMDFPVPHVGNIYKAVLLELIASSINYCYWYGKSSIRPNGAGSTFLGENLFNAFFDYKNEDSEKFNTCMTRFINLLIINRFPLIEERISNLKQLFYMGEPFVEEVINENNIDDLNNLMTRLITYFPGFASDMFLKRTFLFFIQLNRRFGWFKESMKRMPVPADYQVPKMLEHFNCISYSKSLKHTIDSNKLIAKNSIEECEIRSATILTIKKLCDITGWGVSDVDGYFFLRRREVKNPYHLTITTDY